MPWPEKGAIYIKEYCNEIVWFSVGCYLTYYPIVGVRVPNPMTSGWCPWVLKIISWNNRKIPPKLSNTISFFLTIIIGWF